LVGISNKKRIKDIINLKSLLNDKLLEMKAFD